LGRRVAVLKADFFAGATIRQQTNEPVFNKERHMAVIIGTHGDDYLDAYEYGHSNDTIKGLEGDDTLWGWDGKDSLYGGKGDDTLYGEDGKDSLYGGKGVDELWGGNGKDHFYFEKHDSGDINDNKSDTIHDFSHGDEIYLKGHYDYAGDTNTPDEGEYGVWQKDGDWVVTWNSSHDSGYHDVIVKGEDPHHDISFY
jgi:Ca2+-binding RTX toxin-like protein